MNDLRDSGANNHKYHEYRPIFTILTYFTFKQ